MDISDKTRKILWGRSGNRCAICKRELVVDTTHSDDRSVIGDECHIVSRNPGGPRHNDSYHSGEIDLYDNLILLCRTHHKMIDDQPGKYTEDTLHQIKTNHEKWVTQRLSNEAASKPVRIKRIRDNIPKHLTRLTGGNELLGLIQNSYVSYTSQDELKSKEEVDLVGEFFQSVQDLADFGSELEATEHVSASFDLAHSLERLDASGFWVFGARELQLIEGGTEAPSNWPVAYIRVVRKDSEDITIEKQDTEDMRKTWRSAP